MKRLRPFIYLLVIFSLSACQFSLAADITPPPGYQPAQETTAQPQPAAFSGPLYPLVAPDVSSGAAIYAEKCVECHGPRGLGDGTRAAQLPNPVAAIGSPEVARIAKPADWFKMVTQGNLERFMPPFPSLSDRQRWDVVAYAYSLSASEQDVTEGKALYEANCTRCHGESGKGDGPDAAALTQKPGDFSNQEFMASKSNADFYAAISQGVTPDMPAFSDLSEDQRWQASAYVRSLSFAGAAAASTPAPVGTQLSAGGESQAVQTPEPGITTTAEITASGSITATTGVITGTVTNGSTGATVSEGSVMLHAFDQTQNIITQTVPLRADGTFTFENVDMAPGQAFLATYKYNGTTYTSDVAQAEAGKTVLGLPITVYNTTTDASALSVDRLHMFFEFASAESLRVIELYIISNPGNETVVAPKDGEPVVSFALPAGATNLEFQDGALGDRYIQTENGFADTMPVSPGAGTYQVLFAYELPFSKKIDLNIPINMQTNAVVLLVPDGVINVKGDNLEDAGVRPVQGTNYHMYNGSAMSPGQELKLTVSGDPNATSGGATVPTGSKTTLIIGLAALGAVLVLAGVVLFVINRRNQVAELPGQADAAPGQEDDADTVMDAILALDDLYKAGELPEEAYLKRRAELKAHLKELMQS